MVAAIAVLQRTCLVLSVTIGMLPKTVFSNTGCRTQEVYDIKFDFRGKCSMTVVWTTPDQCAYDVARYIVQSAQGCPSSWKSHETLTGNVTSLTIEDLGLVTSCLLGKCHIRVVAEFDRPDQSERKHSHCIVLGDGFHVSSNISTRYYSIIGQQVCLPVRTRCAPNNLIPTFFINQRMIALLTGGSPADEYYLKIHDGLQLCISNNSDSNIVIHEVCHTDANCPLCHEDTGEIVLTSRAEVQTVVSNTTITENGHGSNHVNSKEFDCLPSIVNFCTNTYIVNTSDDTSVSTVEACICLPLHGLHGPDSDGIMVELNVQDNSTFSGTDVLNSSGSAVVTLSPNSMLPQCFEAEIPVQDIQYADKNTSFKICLTLLNSSAKCVYIPEPCTEVKVDVTTGGDISTTMKSTTKEGPDTTTKLDDSNGDGTNITGIIVAAALIGASLILVIAILAIIAIIVITSSPPKKKEYNMRTGAKSDKEQTKL